MDRTINVILVTCSVIVAFAGLYFVLKIWLVWKRVDMNVLRARVFLDDRFLVRNWTYIFIAGAFVALIKVLQLLSLSGVWIEGPGEAIISDLMGLAVVVLLVLLASHWYKLVYSAIGSSHKENVKLMSTNP
ncbi:Uncharacterised protein [uncultured archaeon]|nr:Uncharacterised protein [uncultured archaeon]